MSVPAQPAGPAPQPPAGQEDDAETGVPVFRSWGAIYALVLGSFALWVLLLLALSRMFP
jgi:hypothetical protein